MSNITTHILDTSRGKPAGGVLIVLEKKDASGFYELGRGKTDDDGRLKTLFGGEALERAVYRLTFHVAEYFWRYNIESFHQEPALSSISKHLPRKVRSPLAGL